MSVLRAHGNDDDFAGLAALLDAQSLLERNFVEGIDTHLDAVGFDAAAVVLDPDAHVVVHNALQAHQYFFHVIVSPDFGKAAARA